ncbi:hypothetical protein [Streptomyces sp. NPDC053367]|uniref:hypothetical protein n=1 Tax=Streptomyces sp. NPDC053367 TaxID=3365700 RepID=UPI0037D6B0F6
MVIFRRAGQSPSLGLRTDPDSTTDSALFGGFQPRALERVARWGDGFLAAAPPSWAGGLFDSVRTFWKYGRDGEPRMVAQVNVALGPDAVVEDARRSMHAYYEFTGMPDRMTAALLTTPAAVRGRSPPSRTSARTR